MAPKTEEADKLKQKARHYYDSGFNVLPVKIFVENGKEIKKPNVHSWKYWQTIRMTEEEFNSLSWSNSDYFGVICGFNGFVSIDCDNLNEEDHKKVDVILNEPVTEKMETRRGYHWNYQDGNVRRGEKHTRDKKSFEYLGIGNFVIMGGFGDRYRRVNDNTPRGVDDVYALYKRALEALGWIEKAPLKQLEEKREIRPCVTSALNGKPLEDSVGDKMRLCCAVEYLQAGYAVDQVVEVFRRAPAVQVDFDEKITRKKVEYAKKQEYKPWKCKKIRKLGFCLGAEDCEWNKKFVQLKKKKKSREGEEEESEEKIVQVSRIITKDFIAEEIYDPPNPPQFAVSYFDKDEIKIVNTITLGEEDVKGRPIIYTPVFNDHVKKGMVILPRKPVPCTIKEVVEEATNFVFKSFDPCGKDNELKILVLIPISSWILDKERPLLPVAGIGVFAAIIACRGPSGTGKNRLANLLRFLSYHPLIQLSTYRIPSLYRPLDIWKGTLIIDEADVKNTGATSQLIHFLNSRATGTPIGRQNPESPSKCDAFDSFGQTILTQRQHFDDNATEGRTIPYYCDVSEKRIPTLLTKEQILKGYELQDKLLYIRLKYWKKIKIEKTLWVEKVSDHRLNSILLPIMALAKFDPGLKEIVSSNITVIHEARRKLKAQSDDGVMVNTLWEKIESGLWGTHNNMFYIGREKENYTGADGEEHERVIPLTTSKRALARAQPHPDFWRPV